MVPYSCACDPCVAFCVKNTDVRKNVEGCFTKRANKDSCKDNRPGMPFHGEDRETLKAFVLWKRCKGHLEKAFYSSPRIHLPCPCSGLTLYWRLFVFEATDRGAQRYNLHQSYLLRQDRKFPLRIAGTTWKAGAESKRGAAQLLAWFLLD